MTNAQLMAGIWEAVAQLLRRVGNDDGEDMVRGWTVEGGPGEFEVRRARDLFEASVLATVRAWAAGESAAPEATGPASVPVEATGASGEAQAAGLLRWLGQDFVWGDLTSANSTVALRAAEVLRSVADAVRGCGYGRQMDELLRAHGVDPAAVS